MLDKKSFVSDKCTFFDYPVKNQITIDIHVPQRITPTNFEENAEISILICFSAVAAKWV